MISKIVSYFAQFFPRPMWGVVTLAILSSAILPFVRDVIYIPKAEIMNQLQLRDGMWFAVLFSVYTAAIALGHFLWGWLSHRLDRLTVFRLGMLLLFFSSVLIPYIYNVYQFLFLRFMQGLGVSCQIMMARVLIFHTDYDRNRLAQAFSLSKGIVLLVATFSPVIVAYISTTLFWQANCALVAGMALILWLCSFYWTSGNDTQEAHQGTIDNSTNHNAKMSWWESVTSWMSVFVQLLRYRDYRNYITVGLLGFMLIGAFFASSNLIFLKILNLNIQTYSFIVAVHMLAAAVGVACNSWIVHRWNIGTVLIINVAIVTISYALWLMYLIIFSLDMWSTAGFMFCVSFFTSCITANSMALAVHGVSRKLSGQMFAQVGIINYGVVSAMSMFTGILIGWNVIIFVTFMFFISLSALGFLLRIS